VRTNIDIDDKLMKQAMKVTGARTKKAAVEACMRQTIQLKKQTKILDLVGKVVWRGHDDDWFASDDEIREKHRKAAETPAEAPTSRIPAEFEKGGEQPASTEW
jgi:Arc/MetJ family transcription regulator